MDTKEKYSLLNIRYSGEHGFHLTYKLKSSITEGKPLNRVWGIETERRLLLREFPVLKTFNQPHLAIIHDPYRVQAAIGSVKAGSGHLVTKISREDFETLDTQSLLDKYVRRVARPDKANEARHRPKTLSGGERTTLSSYTFFFIDNSVRTKEGAGMFIPILKYDLRERATNRVKRIQGLYKLGNIYVFTYGTTRMYISLKVVDYRRLTKIMKTSKSSNTSSFMFYKHSWIPISDTLSSKGELVYQKPKYIGTLKAHHQENGAYSEPHLTRLNKEFGLGIQLNNLMHGKRLKRCQAVCEKKR